MDSRVVALPKRPEAVIAPAPVVFATTVTVLVVRGVLATKVTVWVTVVEVSSSVADAAVLVKVTVT